MFNIGSVENLDADHTARVSLRLIGFTDGITMTLIEPVTWIRPGKTVNVQAVWAADPQTKYGTVRVEVTDVTLYDMSTASWDAGFKKSGVECGQATETKAPTCSATNGFTVPLSLVQYVYLQRKDRVQEFGGFVWISPKATVVAPGATKRLYVVGLPTWWRTSFQAMTDSAFWWHQGWRLAADQPGFGRPAG